MIISNEQKIAFFGIAIAVCFVGLVASIGYIGMVSGVFWQSAQFSPESSLENECLNGHKINCNFYNTVINDLLCKC